MFNNTFEFLFTFGSFGEGDGQFGNHGIEIGLDKYDRIIICDRRGKINFFELDGAFISSFGSLGTILNGHFYGPNGIAVDQKGRIVVCDTNNRRLQIIDCP